MPKSDEEIMKDWFETNNLPLNKKNSDHFKKTSIFAFLKLADRLQILKKTIIKVLYG